MAQAAQRQRRKVLVFAHHRSVMNALSRFLEGKMEGFRGQAVRYVRIDGETPDEMRAALRRDFQNDSGIEVCTPAGRSRGYDCEHKLRKVSRGRTCW
jgi:hypothetical protein